MTAKYLLIIVAVALVAAALILVPSPKEVPQTTSERTQAEVTEVAPKTTQTTREASEGKTALYAIIMSSENPENSTLYRVDFLGNTTEKVLDRQVYSFDFSDDGSLYFSDGNSIWMKRGEKVEKVVSGVGSIWNVRAGPEGAIYFSSGDIYRVEGGKPVEALKITEEFISKYLHGKWSQDFDVDSEGNVYISSGLNYVNGEPLSGIVKVTREGKVIPLVEKIKLPTVGLRYVEKLTLNLGGEKVDLSGTLMFTDTYYRVWFLDLKGEKPVLHYLKLPPPGEEFMYVDLSLGPGGA